MDSHVPAFVCPRCHGALHESAAAYRCTSCAADYPIVLGIPDFRIFPDPWIGLEDDRNKARRLAGLVDGMSFADAVRVYWDITPDTPRPLAERFTHHVLSAEDRSRDWLEWLDRAEGAAAAAHEGGPWLDVGCGTGDLLAAGARRGITIVGVDVALRWLVIAARRDALAGRTSQLVCANGEHLPFAPASFARVLSLGTLEHCRDADRVVADCRRVLTRGGVMRAKTVNRYSLLSEPHVGVWGVGMLPRRWADRYVRWRSGQSYLHHRPLSPRELARGFHRAGFSGVSVGAAALLAADRARLGGVTRVAAPLYERLRVSPILGSFIRWVAPLLDVRGVVA
jgi:ubiquinone/menaquinone biosynthesis C-methylase UbiE